MSHLWFYVKAFARIGACLLFVSSAYGQQTMRASIHGSIDTYNSSKSNSNVLRTLAYGNVYETLVQLNHLGEVIPGLAESWEINFEHTELRFKLKRGVKFHDGSEFNCESVQRLILRRPDTRDRIFRRSSMPVLGKLKRASCTTNLEVRLEFEKPYLFAIEDFASFRMSIFFVRIDGFEERYIGTGPYAFRETSGKSLKMVRHSGYWGQPPMLDQINVSFERSEEDAIQSVLEGNSDIALDIQNREGLDKLIVSNDFTTRKNNLRLYFGLLEEKISIDINHNHSLLEIEDFRCGLSAAVDREVMNQNVFYGKGKPLYNIQSVYSRQYNELQKTLSFKDNFAAKVLLSQLPGNKRSKPLELMFIDTKQNHLIAKNFMQMMAGIEINIILRPVDLDEYRHLFYKKNDFDLVITRYPDANMISHYLEGSNIYSIKEDDFIQNLSRALEREGGAIVANARLNSMLQFQHHTCQNIFLLQRPAFYLSSGNWKFSNLNRPSSGFNFATVTVE